LSSCWVN